MPYLKIQTSHEVNQGQARELVKTASALVADKLGKPEQYVMIAFEPPATMAFAGSDEPCVFMELKSIGLSESQTPALSAALCGLASSAMGIPQNRVYIEFADAARKMWGWNGGTF